MVKHHPQSELLASFSAGSLPLSYALCISAHLEFCQECRTNVQRLKRLGAHFFNEQAPMPASDKLKSKVFAALELQPDNTATTEPVKPPTPKDVPKCLAQFVPAGYDQIGWQSVTPSIKSSKLCRDGNDTQVSIMRLKPGAKVNHHRHAGEELTLVLKGSFSDEEGIYQKGDFLLRNSHHRHTPIASKDAECICLTVQDAPIQFTGYFSRMLNPLLERDHWI